MTQLVNKFVRTTRERRVLIMQGLVLVGIARVGLPFMSTRRVAHILRDTAKWLGRSSAEVKYEDLLWVLSVVGRRVSSTCLMNALAGHALLTAHRYPVTLRVGAALNDGKFAAHAWLERDNEIVMGGPTSLVEKYTAFPGFDGWVR